ncbi:MAG: tyrosine-type recombinase/integrase [Vibrio toranzoniae]|uniref:tyrosine-type recombinase/integrase n=1 Tax=Vibrio toranzoniae TaxID=1194427 RepID=UPI003F9E0B6F
MRVSKVALDDSNERVSIIVDECDCPVDDLNYYIITELRGRADNTLRNAVYALLHIHRFSLKKDISLLDEMSTRCFENSTLFTSFINHLQQKSMKSDVVVSKIKPELVQPDHFDSRIDAAKKYLSYLFERGISKRRIDDPLRVSLNESFNRLMTKLESRKLKDSSKPSKEGLSVYQQASLFKALEHREFCGWSELTLKRNKLIVYLFYSTGIRKGELASLTIPNCHTNVPAPYIVTSQNVKHIDPRMDVPHEKTRERVIPISIQLAQMIDEYKSERSKSSEAKKQPPFLLLSTHTPHSPMSMSSIGKIFSSIVKAIPDIDSLGAHKIRHTFFENLDRHLANKGYTDEDKKKLKNNIGGWSPSSNTSETYEVLSTREQCVEVLSQLQKDQDGLYGNEQDELPF